VNPTNLHTMDECPPDAIGEWLQGVSVDVTLVYADGDTERGYRDPWLGWIRWTEDRRPFAVENDATQPIGWRMLEVAK